MKVFTNFISILFLFISASLIATSETFEDIFPKIGIKHFSHDGSLMSAGVIVLDYNNDGWLDYYATNIGQNYFFENANAQAFIERGKELKIDNTNVKPGVDNSGLTVSWSLNWFDFDLDMDVDLYVSNGFLLPIPGLNTE